MRRPLKPFVTEYKGTRRQTPSQPVSEATPRASEFRAFEGERSRPRSLDAPLREEAEDSYEAAMRAADALFARPAQQRQPVAAETDAAGSDAAASERGGRILRALDEPPPPQLVALEAVHAPKRRGRKPGSKNKPKTKVAEVAVEGLTDLPTQAGLLAGVASEDPAALAVITDEAGSTPTAQKPEAIPTTHASSNGSKRFSWVRDRLKPGEGWKRRRLPRICW